MCSDVRPGKETLELRDKVAGREDKLQQSGTEPCKVNALAA